MTTTIAPDYSAIALGYAERYGIIDYTVDGNTMVYRESFPTEGTYEATVELDSLTETRRAV